MADYVHPEVLVSTEWVAEHLADPKVRIVESDEDRALYAQGHVPGAVEIDWAVDLQDATCRRDYIDRAAFERLCAERGISNDTTVVFYGDKNNWWACYAFWVFKLYGHTDCRIMNGGRKRWELDGRAWSSDRVSHPRAHYTATEQDGSIRALRDEVLKHQKAGKQLLDVRSPEEYRGERMHMPDYPNEGAVRGGHIPGARQRSLADELQRGRHVQVGEGTREALHQGAEDEAAVAHDRLLPDRRAVEPDVVRAHLPARLRQREELRRLVARVGQLRPRADREGRRAGRTGGRRRPPPSPAVHASAHGKRAGTARRELIGEFADLDGREKLELLVDFANGLPPLPPEYEARKAVEDRRVHECQTPVFLWMEVDGGTARLVAEVAPEAPTVKGFVADPRRGRQRPAGGRRGGDLRRHARADGPGRRAGHPADPGPAGDRRPREARLRRAGGRRNAEPAQ